ncbi:hypothetical protein [Sphingosinicella sp.]|uniref:hypothetical protein n=1 Tax=Sphingosinicella sp. TaxID=1917971 RepID=UPI0040376EC8
MPSEETPGTSGHFARIRDELDALQRRVAASTSAESASPLEIAYRLRHERAARDAILPAELSGEPAWALLLAIFVGGEEGRQPSQTALLRHLGLASATGIRWLERLESAELILARAPPTRKNGKIYGLSDKGLALTSQLLMRIGQNG